MDKEEISLAEKINAAALIKLDAACKIVGITPEDTVSGKKSIQVFDLPGSRIYYWTEKRIPLVKIIYGDNVIRIVRITRLDYWWTRLFGLKSVKNERRD